MCNNFVLVGRLVTTSNVEDGDVILTIGLRKEDSEEQELIPIKLKGAIANSVNEYCEKGIIFFLPDYAEKVEYDNYISCIKIVAKDTNKLKHKDFMGSIYAMGIKNDFIGDIFVTVNAAYVYILKEVENFLLDNLFKVEYIEKTYIIPSRRIDALLSEVYNLSRKETKEKIVAGDLYVNAAECINPSIEFYEGDIVSFRRCGKLKVGPEIRTTKSGNICINIYRYK